MMIHEAIQAIHPDAKFSVFGNSYAGIEWLSPDLEKPSEAELKKAWKNGQVARDALVEIERLEALQTMRRMSEAMPDESGGSDEGRKWMKANRDAITVERSKL